MSQDTRHPLALTFDKPKSIKQNSTNVARARPVCIIGLCHLCNSDQPGYPANACSESREQPRKWDFEENVDEF